MPTLPERPPDRLATAFPTRMSPDEEAFVRTVNPNFGLPPHRGLRPDDLKAGFERRGSGFGKTEMRSGGTTVRQGLADVMRRHGVPDRTVRTLMGDRGGVVDLTPVGPALKVAEDIRRLPENVGRAARVAGQASRALADVPRQAFLAVDRLRNRGVKPTDTVSDVGRVVEASMLVGAGSALSMVGRRVDPNSVGMFYRPRSPDAARQAEAMQRNGADPSEIWRVTGLERGVDDVWRAELDTSTAQINFAEARTRAGADNKITFLDEILDFPDLYKLYPNLRTLPVEIAPGARDGIRGVYLSGKETGGVISMYIDPSSMQFRNTLLHEIQHAVQDRDGFPMGFGNPRSESARLTRRWKERIEGILFDITDDEQLARRILDDATERGVMTSGTIPNEFVGLFGEVRSAWMDFSTGLNTAGFRQYARLRTEVEARNVSERDRMRRFGVDPGPPRRTEDIPRSEQVVTPGEGDAPISVQLAERRKREAIAAARRGPLPEWLVVGD